MALTEVVAIAVADESFRVFKDSSGVFWFHGTEACKILELSNPSQSIQRRVWPEYRQQISYGRGMPAWYVKQAGLYQLIFASKTEKAVHLQRTVFEDVLPGLQKDGGYIMPTATSEQIKGLEQKLQSMQKRMAFFGHDKKTVFNMFKILVNHNGMSDELIEAFKPFAGGKRFTIDEFEALIPTSVKLPWKDDNV